MDMKKCNKCHQLIPITHFSVRSKSNDGLMYACKTCEKVKADLFRLHNKESLNERSKLRRRITRAKDRELKSVATLAAKKERKIVSMRKHREYYHSNKERLLKNAKERNSRNPHLARSRAAEIRHKRRIGFSKILSKEQKKEIVDLRIGAKILEMLFGERYSIDHIIPINNKNVCGLHAPWNLQILPYIENNRKLNRFDGTYDNESWRKLL